MQEQLDIKKDFDALCNKYGGIPEESDSYMELWYLFLKRRQGYYLLPYEEADSYFPALEIAKLLKQLRSSMSGRFSLKMGKVYEKYFDPTLVELLKKSLEDALLTMIEKTDFGCLHITYGKHKTCLISCDYPDGCTPKDNGLSEDELDQIIKMGDIIKERNKKFAGHSTGNQAIGAFVLDLTPYLPIEWNAATKNAFLMDFLCWGGFLDFLGKSRVENLLDKLKEDKDSQVRSWVRAYITMLEKNPSIKESYGEK